MADTTFDIVIRYTGDLRYQPLFDAAAARWEQIIIADIPDLSNTPFGPIDDLLIEARVVAIDGSGRILARAGPTYIRTASGLPLHGEMQFDSADVSGMFNDGTLYDVILHEMGHVLGIGTLWDWHGLINGFQYIGANAVAEYRLLTGNSSATSVPVENNGGPGTAGGHWEEDIFNAELMTGYIEASGVAMPLSRLTVASLADMGYTVNMGAADAFSLPTTIAANDFDGDHDSDILWNHSDGSVRTWEMQAGALNSAHNLPAATSNWHIEGTGDFDHDGDSDIIWRHDEGAVVTWEMEGGSYVVNHNIAFASTGWRIEGFGDFDHDGDSDVVWRHTEGLVVTWEMEGGSYVVNHNIAYASNGWRIDGFGDFDGDSDSDIIWRHDEGAVVTWEMEGGSYVVNHNIATATNSWQIQGTGDFDRDGDADILWRHTDGAVVAWEMEGGSYVVNHRLGTLGTNWQFQGTGDFDGDGDDDILWRQQEAVVTWEMQGGEFAGANSVGVISTAWHVRGTGDFDLA